MLHLEVCVDTVEGAMAAERGGATRLELCANLILGGTTPSVSLLELVKESVDIPVHVIMRPRFGDFCYTDLEFEEMKRQVTMMKNHGADGVVIGIVKPEGLLDEERMATLIKVAKPMHIALHRAFDVCMDPFKTLETAKNLGVQTILTSGQKQTALEGADLLGELVEKADGKIDIMPGSGVNAKNISEMIKKTDATSYHMSGRTEKESSMTYRKQGVSMGLPILSEYTLFQTNSEKIKAVMEIIKSNLTK